MNYVAITKGDTNYLLPGGNFTGSEYHPNSSPYMNNQSAFPDTFYIAEPTILGAQAIRTYYGKPTRVNASGRTKPYNTSIGGSDGSKHLLGQYRGDEENHILATDLDFFNKPYEVSLLKDFHYQVLNGGPLVDQLKQLGINGFGLYDTFIHIDARPASEAAVWDNRVSTKGSGNFLQQYAENIQKFIATFGNGGEDGFKDFALGAKKKVVQLLILALIIYLAIKIVRRYA